MDGTLGTISRGQLAPRCARPQNPENAFKTLAISQWWASAFAGALALGQMDFDGFSLLIRYASPSH